MRFVPSGLRGRLFLLFAVALLPALAIVAYVDFADYRNARALADSRVVATAEEARSEQPGKAAAAALYEEATRAYFTDMAILLSAAGLMFGAVWWGISDLVLRQVRALLEVARRQREGDAMARAPVAGVREFAELAEGLNAMLDARSQAEADLRESESARAQAERIGGTGNWSWEIEQDQLTWSFAGAPLAGPFTLAEAFAQIHPEDRERVLQTFSRSVRTGAPVDCEIRITEGPDAGRTLLLTGKVQGGTHEKARRLAGALQDVSERLRAKAALEHTSNFDALTGLPNRNLLADRLSLALADARRTGRLVGALWLNVDRFQRVNESYGRAAGDSLLTVLAQRLAGAVRETDTVARMGGDQFVILLPELKSPAVAGTVARKLTEAMRPTFSAAGQEVFLELSIGIAQYPSDAESGPSLLAKAEVAMLRAKGQGGLGFYTPAMNAAAADRLELETALRRALERNEFLLHYQPRVRLRDGRINGVEALIRWQHPSMGMVSPGEFISLAEETGLIVPIGQWVLETACAQSRRWLNAGHQGLRMAVNLSPRQFRQPDLVEAIERALGESGIPASALELEVTESVAMDNPAASREILSRLKALGVALAIDDFGTGHSSLGYLSTFPLDYLKVDQSFVRGTPENNQHSVIVRSVIGLGQNLGLEVIAEGVETEAQMRFLQSEGCEEAQGYLFSRPLAPDALAPLLQAGYTPLIANG
jgi:diguanylate cyclase (GGDEF)-like protein